MSRHNRYDKQARVSFLKEVSLLRALAHDNVLRFVSVIANKNKLYLITGLSKPTDLLSHPASQPTTTKIK